MMRRLFGLIGIVAAGIAAERSGVYETVGQLLLDVGKLAGDAKELLPEEDLQNMPVEQALALLSRSENTQMEFAKKRVELYERMSKLLDKQCAELMTPLEAVGDRDRGRLKEWTAAERRRIEDRLALWKAAGARVPGDSRMVEIALKERLKMLDELDRLALGSAERVGEANALIQRVAEQRGREAVALRQLADGYRQFLAGARQEVKDWPRHHALRRAKLKERAAAKRGYDEEEGEWRQ